MAERLSNACSSTVILWLEVQDYIMCRVGDFKGVGHFECIFQMEGGVAHQPL